MSGWSRKALRSPITFCVRRPAGRNRRDARRGLSGRIAFCARKSSASMLNPAFAAGHIAVSPFERIPLRKRQNADTAVVPRAPNDDVARARIDADLKARIVLHGHVAGLTHQAIAAMEKGSDVAIFCVALLRHVVLNSELHAKIGGPL